MVNLFWIFCRSLFQVTLTHKDIICRGLVFLSRMHSGCFKLSAGRQGWWYNIIVQCTVQVVCAHCHCSFPRRVFQVGLHLSRFMKLCQLWYWNCQGWQFCHLLERFEEGSVSLCNNLLLRQDLPGELEHTHLREWHAVEHWEADAWRWWCQSYWLAAL